jgi:hypothetical protein
LHGRWEIRAACYKYFNSYKMNSRTKEETHLQQSKVRPYAKILTFNINYLAGKLWWKKTPPTCKNSTFFMCDKISIMWRHLTFVKEYKLKGRSAEVLEPLCGNPDIQHHRHSSRIHKTMQSDFAMWWDKSLCQSFTDTQRQTACADD